jgi:outer membrane protein assembly factor BamB
MSIRAVGGLLVIAAVVLGIVAWRGLSPPSSAPSRPREPEVVGRFETIERGALVATPFVTTDRIYIAAIRDTGLQPTGAIHCLDRATLRPLWTFDDGGAMLHMFSSPVVAAGRLYVGEGMHANFECHLYCVDATTGQKIWTHSAGNHIESTAVILDDHVVFGAGDDGLVCLQAADGARVWKLDWPSHIDTTPIVGDGVIFAGSGVSRRVPAEPAAFALSADTGRIRWRTPFELPVWATPALADGVLYVGLANGRLLEGPQSPEPPRGAVVALDATSGKERWRFTECDAVFGAPATDAARVYVGSRDGNCYALDRATGRRVWSRFCDSAVVAGPVWAGGSLVVASSEGLVNGLDPATGDVQWQFDVARHSQTRPRILAPPAVARQDARELLYLSTELRTPAASAAVMYILRP